MSLKKGKRCSRAVTPVTADLSGVPLPSFGKKIYAARSKRYKEGAERHHRLT